MGLTSSGPICDVCGKYILPLGDEGVNWFRCGGVRDLCCHNACKAPVLEMTEKKDWKVLPAGPLREAFEVAEQKDVDMLADSLEGMPSGSGKD